MEKRKRERVAYSDNDGIGSIEARNVQLISKALDINDYVDNTADDDDDDSLLMTIRIYLFTQTPSPTTFSLKTIAP